VSASFDCRGLGATHQHRAVGVEVIKNGGPIADFILQFASGMIPPINPMPTITQSN
jgi:hypothetical protein